MHPALRALACVALSLAAGAAAAQPAATPAELREQARRAADRIRTLQAEADRLAEESRTVFVDLRALELERQMRLEETAARDAELAAVEAELAAAAARVERLEAERLAATPGVAARLVDIYKRGRGGYVRLLFAIPDIRSLGRLTRGVAAVAALDEARIGAHRRTLAAERQALADLEGRRRAVEAARAEAAAARTALDRAVAARNRLIDDLDRRRDLAARYIGELQAAQTALDAAVSGAAGASAVTLPLAPFRGTLDWPVRGRVLTRFGRSAGRFGTAIVRNGIEIDAAEGSPVAAVHEGTVAYAAPFTGFGTLVILDHGGGAFTLYGHLQRADVAPGARVPRGGTVGRAGLTPAGGPAVYFELRIDGRPVNPLQWLRSAP
ncbi:MAG: peptidoglycan DD-metalloendopeptidase family protein [Acidobacteriota bacterium]